MSGREYDSVINLRPGETIEVNIDIGQVPVGHPYVGQFVVTLQVAPFKKLSDAQECEKAIREVVGSRLGVRFSKSE